MKKIIYNFVIISLLSGCLPKSDKYPYKDPELIKQEGRKISDNLESYIKKWLAGQVPSQIPDSLIPPGVLDNKGFVLKKPEDATDEEAWAFRKAKPIVFDSIYNGLPDPHVTYLFLGTPLAPFGSKLVIEGEFPHARFFSIQVTPPLNGKEYYAGRVFGTAEVSFVDADINPLPGNLNPFRPNADRNSPNRKFRVEYNLDIGDPVALNNNAHKPLYVERGNIRSAGLIVYQGPWGLKNGFLGTPTIGGGEWDLGAVWIRIYAPDKDKDFLGGVPFPKAWFELPTGEKYFISSDFSVFKEKAYKTVKAQTTNKTGNPRYGAHVGWFKSWGIVRNVLTGVLLANGWSNADSLKRVSEIDLGATGRGENQPPPGNYEAHATVNNYASYLGRSATVESGKVLVLTGKMPTFPHTREGDGVMERSQLRYWSIGGYDFDPFGPMPGAGLHNVMDDEVILDSNRYYTIVYSKLADRPANATLVNGVTWINIGPTNDFGLMMRYVSVNPEWVFEKSPHELNLTWAKTDLAGSQYDPSIVGRNSHKGFMECYLPRVSYLTKSEFEALGSNLAAENIPVWIDEQKLIGVSEAINKTALSSTTYNDEATYQPFKAFDGNLSTRWASKYGNGQWLQVDLGRTMKISGIKIFWEFSAASSYQIQVSNDNANWTNVFSTTSGDGDVDIIKNLNISGRYVRLNATVSNTGFYSIYEMEIYSHEMACATLPSATIPSVNLTVNQIQNEENNFNLYPNPVSNYLKFVVSNPSYIEGNQFEITITDYNSKVYFKQNLKSSTNLINTSALKSGVYLLTLRYNNKVVSQKFIKND